MKKTKVKNNFKWPFCISILAHGAIIISLILASPMTSYRLNNTGDNSHPIVQASVVLAPTTSVQTVQNPQPEPPKLQEKKKVEQVRVAEIKAAQKLQKVQQIQQAQQALAQAKALEIKKQQEAAQAKALEVKKQKDAKQKQAELQAKQAALQQQMMQEQIANEQAQITKAQQMQGILDQYRARILLAIGSQWLIPDGVDPTISCVFTIELMEDGKVAHVQLVKSSGNTALDRAAETAIYKASPLPVPKDPDPFAPFRRFTLKMTPQEIKR